MNYINLYELLTKFGISRSVFNRLTCPWTTFKGVIEGYKRPVQTGLNWCTKTSLFAVFDFKISKTRTAVQSFPAFSGLETGLPNTTSKCFRLVKHCIKV